jgi:predicted phage terminase large subunit-like protein
MTRWHEEDLIGRISQDAERREGFDVVSIPALAEADDILGREEGEALWPKRYTREKLLKLKAQNGSRWFSSMYQQRPVPDDSVVFGISHFGKYKLEDDLLTYKSINGETNKLSLSKCRVIITCDLAIAGSKESDSSVFLVSAISSESIIFLLHCEIFKGGGLENEKRLRVLNKKYDPIAIGLETVAYQKAFMDRMGAEGLPVVSLVTKESKLLRAQAMQPYVEAGSVYLPHSGPWLDAFIQQITRFPNTKHDDIVDAFSYIRQFIGDRAYLPQSKARRKGMADGFGW